MSYLEIILLAYIIYKDNAILWFPFVLPRTFKFFKPKYPSYASNLLINSSLRPKYPSAGKKNAWKQKQRIKFNTRLAVMLCK